MIGLSVITSQATICSSAWCHFKPLLHQFLSPLQVKYSELTLDMFRMLQVLEREPSEEPHLYDTSPAAGRNPLADPHNAANSERLAKRENPHKYLLYKPTFGQIYNFLAHGLKELPQGTWHESTRHRRSVLIVKKQLENSRSVDWCLNSFKKLPLNNRQTHAFVHTCKHRTTPI